MSRLLMGAVVITMTVAGIAEGQQPYERVTVTERFAPMTNAPTQRAPVAVQYRTVQVPVYVEAPPVRYVQAPVVVQAPMVMYATSVKYATSVDRYGLFGRKVRVNYSDGTSRRVK